MRKTVNWRRRLTALLAVLGAVVLASSASQALGAIPHSATGVITACHNAAGALRVVDAQAGATCAAGESQLSWHGTAITASRWNSSAVIPLTRSGGVAQAALRQPTAKLPAGTWTVAVQVLIAYSLEPPASFRCYTQSRGRLVFVAGQLQDWGGNGGWHRTLSFTGLVTLPEADWVDVFCLHDQNLPSGGILQVESVEVVVQRVAAVF